MKYALGNMLNGAGGFNPDGLSLDLQFAADKTLTARKGPTPVLTRSQVSPTGSTYVGSDGLIKYADNNAPRFDHDPVTFACKGLLIEDQRFNLLASSAEFDKSPWSSSIVTITPNDGVSPDGLTTAESLLFAGTDSVLQTVAMGSTAPTATFSLFVKAKTGAGFARIIIGNGSPPTNLFGGWFNLSTGLWGTTAIAGAATLVGTSVTNFNNGWYRISITGSISGLSSYTPFLYITDSDNSTVRSTTVSQLWWGAQLEVGSFPTSYIPTTTTSLARSADVCSITGSNFTGMYNQAEGAMLVNAFTPALGIRNIVSCSYLINKEITLLTNESAAELEVKNDGPQVDMSSGSPITPNTAFKLACAYKLNNFAVTKDNVTPQTDTSGTVPTVITMLVGSGPLGNTMCGCISSLTYYKKRLSDAKIQTLTAP